MNSRERVMRCVAGKDVDRPPIYYSAEDDAHQALKEALGLETDEEVYAYFSADAMRVEGRFKEGFKHPDLSSVETDDDIERAAWVGAEMLDVEACVRQARQAHATGRAVYGGVWASIFTVSRHLMGEEKYLITLAMQPDLITHLVQRLTDSYLALNAAYFDACREYVDIYFFGSDLGTQRSLFVSPDALRQCIFPGMKRLVDQARGYGRKVMFHTCGAVRKLIPDFIELGIDILDPVQVSAAEMEPEGLVEFKDRIIFHGGISTQKVLPYCTPEEVRAHVLHTIETLGPQGYIAAPDQNIQRDVPLENVEMVFETIRKFRN